VSVVDTDALPPPASTDNDTGGESAQTMNRAVKYRLVSALVLVVAGYFVIVYSAFGMALLLLKYVEWHDANRRTDAEPG
jgi:hypothetical protein